MSIIRIKRSTTSGSPNVLAVGELAYSALPNNDSNGGDRLYLGGGTETAGNASDRIVIGGKYFTDLLDHTRGILTADSALIADSNKKLDELLIDNLSLNGNIISSTNTDGNISVLPNGSGKTIIKNPYIENDQTSLADLISNAIQSELEIEGTANEIEFSSSVDSFGIKTFVGNLSDIFTPDTFGSGTEVPVITVDSKGRITEVTTQTISTEISVEGDTGEEDVSLLTDTLNFVSGAKNGISVDITRSTNDVFVTVSLDQDLSETGSPKFDSIELTSGEIETNSATASVFNENATNLNIGNDATTISIGAANGTTTINNDLIVGGDVTVQGTLTSIETVNLQTDDPLVKFGRGNTADALSIGFYGEYVDGGNTLKAGFFRDHVSKEFFLFKNLDEDLQTNQINATVSSSGIELADLNVGNLYIENDLLIDNDLIVTGNITGNQINATLFVGEIDGGTY